MPFDSVTERPHQGVRFDLAFDQIILGPLLDSRHGNRLIIQPGEDNDRAIWHLRLHPVKSGQAAVAVGQRQIQQHDVRFFASR